MKRKKVSKLLDIIVVDDALQIRAIAEDSRVDRVFVRRPLLNALILKRRLGVLSYQGTRFPHQQPHGDPARAARQTALWERYNDKAGHIAGGPEVLADLARWVRGELPDAQPGVLAQQVAGSFFYPVYRATAESWAAAVTVSTASVSRNIPKMLWWFVSGKVKRAKILLGGLANDDLSCIHATTVAVHNIAASVIKMKAFYGDEEKRKTLGAERVADLCLAPPSAVYRQATANGVAGGCPFSKYSLLLLKLGKADSQHTAKDLVFMTGSWSRCPASTWVPAMLAGVWRRACAIRRDVY